MQTYFLPFLTGCLLFLLAGLSPLQATVHTVTNSGLTFTPANLEVSVGDTVIFNIGSSHNVVEVTQATFNANGTTSNGGFSLPFGGGTIIIDEANTYYYVCQPHAGAGMKGTIVATAAASPADIDSVFVAKLSGSQEVPPIAGPASGSIRAVLAENTLTLTGEFSGLQAAFDINVLGGSHVHEAYAGSNGGIEFNLVPTIPDADSLAGTFEAEDNTIILDPDQIEALLARRLYVNIHTKAFPGGELRGQLLPEADEQFEALLFGSNEVPPIMSMGSGHVMLELEGDSLFVSGSFSGLESPFNDAVGAHLHLGFAGQNGGVEIPLNPVIVSDTSGFFAVESNRFELTMDQKMALMQNQLYVNIHSANIPSGELRGQVHPLANAILRAFLAGSNEAPPVLSPANGQVILTLCEDTLTVSGAFSDFSSPFDPSIGMTGAHLHRGLAGQNGGIEILLNPELEGSNLAGTFLPTSNTVALTSGQKDTLLSRGYYVNLHSQDNPSGEIRGQVVPQSNFFFNAPLGGAQERPSPVNTPATGNVIAEFLGNQLTVSGAFSGLVGDFDETIGGTGAHIHFAPAGSNGPISILLNVTEDGDQRGGQLQAAANDTMLRTGQLDTLRQRLGYVNIHTSEVPSGEIRGQLLKEATAFFSVQASGANEVPPNDTTSGIGGLVAEWNGSQLGISGSFENLIGKFDPNIAEGSHIHLGNAGTNGPIAFILDADITEMDSLSGQYRIGDNQFSLNADTVEALFAQGLYFNLHTTAAASGEIRGQVLPVINLFPDTADITSPPSDFNLTIEGDPSTPFVAEWSDAGDPNGNPASYVWQLAADPTFANPLVTVNRADTNSFATDFGTVASILEGAGLEVGQSIKVYHRVITGDGSLNITGSADSVNLTLGDIVTSTFDRVTDRFELNVFPNPATDWINIRIEAAENAEAILQMFDLSGRMIEQRNWDLFRGANQQQLSLSNIPKGTYFIQVLVDGQPFRARKVTLSR